MPGVPVTACAPAKACTPAKAGAQRDGAAARSGSVWAPAFAGEQPHRSDGGTRLLALPALTGALPLLLAGCAAAQSAAAVQPDSPGFWLGLWHGFIFPVAWAVSLFVEDVSIYAVPNNGGWYDFGYFLGIVVFGVGARKSAVRIGGVRSSTDTIAATHHEESR
jgi:hypothetical protein